MAAAGMSPAEIEAELGGRRDEGTVLEVWPENWPIWQAWLALSDCWRLVVGFSGIGYQCLAPADIEATLNLQGVRGRAKRRRIFEGLKVMEQAARPVLNESKT